MKTKFPSSRTASNNFTGETQKITAKSSSERVPSHSLAILQVNLILDGIAYF